MLCQLGCGSKGKRSKALLQASELQLSYVEASTSDAVWHQTRLAEDAVHLYVKHCKGSSMQGVAYLVFLDLCSDRWDSGEDWVALPCSVGHRLSAVVRQATTFEAPSSTGTQCRLSKQKANANAENPLSDAESCSCSRVALNFEELEIYSCDV